MKSPKLGSISPDMMIFLVMDITCKCKRVTSYPFGWYGLLLLLGLIGDNEQQQMNARIGHTEHAPPLLYLLSKPQRPSTLFQEQNPIPYINCKPKWRTLGDGL
jgi:hypothetical protein